MKVVLLFLLLSYQMLSIRGYVRVCYFTNWSQYRASPAKFLPSDIDPDVCTHIVYAFAQIKNGITTSFEHNDDQRYKEVIGLKKHNQKLKVLLAVGGWNHEKFSSPFSVMVSDFGKRKRYITNAIVMLRKYGF